MFQEIKLRVGSMSKPNTPRPNIMVAPNGARRDYADHPALPITIEEIVAETVACVAAGADALHLHVRDDAGRHSLDGGRYLETLAALNAALPGFPVQITTEAAGLFDVTAQLTCIQAVRPAAASIAVREMARDVDCAAQVYALCDHLGTQVQHIVYDATDWARLSRWRDAGLVRTTQTDVIFVLGHYAPPRDATCADLFNLPRPATDWAVCAFGPQEQEVLIAAARLGAKLRVGFENNVHAPDGTVAASTAANVAALRAALAQPQSEVA